jgi:methenyltetrahydrofolate cyclohydrolase
MLTSLSVTEFLNETASHSPAPGGGSISAFAAALGSGLTSMVCRLTIGKKKYTTVQLEIENMLKKSEKLRTQFTSLIDEDTGAFNKVMAAFGLPKETEKQKSQRTLAIQEATRDATLVPLKLMELCVDAIALVKIVAEKGNQNSLSDAGVAVLMVQAACDGAALNVKTNLNSLQDTVFIQNAKEKMDSYLKTVKVHSQQILKFVNTKL